MSNFYGWDSRDFIEEAKVCYTCICDSSYNFEDKQLALDILNFILIDDLVDDQTQLVVHSLWEECATRLYHLKYGTDIKQSRDLVYAAQEYYDPNMCKSCRNPEPNYELIGASNICCTHCGQDFDKPAVNWYD